MTRSIALFRATEDAERSAARLARLGFAAAIAPVVEPRALPAAAPAGPFDAVIATSAKAIVFFDGLVDAPLHVVGARAAAEALPRGWRLAAPPDADAAAMARRLKSALPRGARLLYLAGRDRRPELEAGLRADGRQVETLEVYEAAARTGWSEAEIEALRACDAAFHYSRRSAELAGRFAAAAGLAEFFRALRHVAMSPEAAAPLLALGAADVAAAAAPDEEAMIAALDP